MGRFGSGNAAANWAIASSGGSAAPASARSIDEGPVLAPVPRPDERLTAAKRGAHAVIPLGLAPDHPGLVGKDLTPQGKITDIMTQ